MASHAARVVKLVEQLPVRILSQFHLTVHDPDLIDKLEAILAGYLRQLRPCR